MRNNKAIRINAATHPHLRRGKLTVSNLRATFYDILTLGPPVVKCPNSTAFVATQLVPTRAPQQQLLAPILRNKSTKTRSSKGPWQQLEVKNRRHLPGISKAEVKCNNNQRKRKKSNAFVLDNMMLMDDINKSLPEQEGNSFNGPDDASDLEQLSQRLEKIAIETRRETTKLQKLHEDATDKKMNVEELRKEVEASARRLDKLHQLRKRLTARVLPKKVRRPLSARGRVGESRKMINPVLVRAHSHEIRYKDPLHSTEPGNKRPKLRHAAVVRAIAESTAKDLVRTSLVRATIQMHKQIRSRVSEQR